MSLAERAGLRATWTPERKVQEEAVATLEVDRLRVRPDRKHVEMPHRDELRTYVNYHAGTRVSIATRVALRVPEAVLASIQGAKPFTTDVK